MEKFFRNLGVISEREQEILRKTGIAVVGLGGTGGTAFECLLRVGAEHFVLFDRDRFELTNFNRQLLATDVELDKRKVDAAMGRALNINKNAKCELHGEFDATKIKKSGIVIDGTDNVKTHVAIATACRKLRLPHVFCSASFAMGMVSVFTGQKFEKIFQLPSSQNPRTKTQDQLARYNTCTSVIAPATMLGGTLAAAQAINYLLKKPFVRAPDVLFFDLFSERVAWKERLE